MPRHSSISRATASEASRCTSWPAPRNHHPLGVTVRVQHGVELRGRLAALAAPHQQRRHRDGAPFVPAALRVHGEQDLVEHVRVPSSPQPVGGLLESVGPGLRGRPAAKEVHRGPTVGERLRPRPEPVADGCGVLCALAADAALEQHEPGHRLGPCRRGHQRRVAAAGLPDQHYRAQRQVVDHRDHVRHVSCTRQVLRLPGTAAVAAGVERDHAGTLRQQVRDAAPLEGAAAEPVQQQQTRHGAGPCRHPGVEDAQAHAVALDHVGVPERTGPGARGHPPQA